MAFEVGSIGELHNSDNHYYNKSLSEIFRTNFVNLSMCENRGVVNVLIGHSYVLIGHSYVLIGHSYVLIGH